MVRILFVCMGNICRSPTAEAVMRGLVEEAGLSGRIEVDSAGTGDWHVGAPPDRRSVAAAERRGVGLDGAARQVTRADFDNFDLLVALDATNARALHGLARDEEAADKIRLLREFDPSVAGAPDLDVPDPYGGDARGFEEVLDLVDAACRGLLHEARERAGAA